MAKELPYFRFTASEWLNGDISLEAIYMKGIFIDICAYYWFKDCSVTKAMLKKRFSSDVDAILELIELEILKYDEESDYLCINFLNEQYDILSEQRKNRQAAGSKGGKQKSSNAKAKLKQKPSYKDKDKDKNKYKETPLSELINNSDFEPKEYLEITLAFWDLFKHNLEIKNISTVKIEKANGKWIDNIRLLIENDKYTLDDLREIFKFLQVNEFWKANILSTSKLREQFEKLLLNARKDEQQGNKKEGCTIQELAEVVGKHFATDKKG